MDYKQALVVRKDLGMGVGKIAAQVAHASLMACEKARIKKKEWFFSWFEFGQAKIVLKVNSFEEIIDLRNHAENLGLPVAQVMDSGYTQIPHGTTTCLGIGPGPVVLIDKVTHNLKLL